MTPYHRGKNCFRANYTRYCSFINTEESKAVDTAIGKTAESNKDHIGAGTLLEWLLSFPTVRKEQPFNGGSLLLWKPTGSPWLFQT